MKVLLFVCSALFLSGCMTAAPKETTKNIFVLVHSRDFDKARMTFDETNKAEWETYADQKISWDSVKSLVEDGVTYVGYCDRLVSSLQKSRETFATQLAEDELTAVDEASDQAESIEHDFRQTCEFQENGLARTPVANIYKYSSVNLFVTADGTKKKFDHLLSDFKADILVHKKALHIKDKAEEEAERKFEDPTTVAYQFRKLCEMQGIINIMNSNIASENEAAKISGFVDKVKMYNYGKTIHINQERIKHFGSEYKRKFGKTWSSDQCK